MRTMFSNSGKEFCPEEDHAGIVHVPAPERPVIDMEKCSRRRRYFNKENIVRRIGRPSCFPDAILNGNCLRLVAGTVLSLVVMATDTQPPATVIPPRNIRVVYSEKSLQFEWDSVPGAIGYNLYSSPEAGAPKRQRRKVNSKLIESGTRFTYIWHMENGEQRREIKGRRHYCVLTSVFTVNGAMVESGFSGEINNCYFEGFRNMTSKKALERVLASSQTTALLPIKTKRNNRDAFIEFMTGPARLLQSLLLDSLDFQDIGACVPISTIVSKLLLEWDLYGYRVEGTFIKEFHSFVVINVDSVEYILDFAADQFVPGVSPVVVPRDRAFLDRRGKLAPEGIPVYLAGKIFSPDQASFTENESSRIFRILYDDVAATRHSR